MVEGFRATEAELVINTITNTIDSFTSAVEYDAGMLIVYNNNNYL